MTLITSSYWQQGRNDSALLLQHYRHRETPLCFVCLCAGEGEKQGRAGAYLTEQLLQWFRGLSWRRLIRNPEGQLPGLGGQLKEIVERTGEELAACGFLTEQEMLGLAGILCIGAHFLLFDQNGQRIYLLNRSFGRGYVQRIAKGIATDREPGFCLQQGILQQEVGLLLATESFCGQVTEQELKECLHVEELHTQDQADRHLRELGHQAEEQGGRHMGAVLLLTGSEGGEDHGKSAAQR